jgi:hypothetical protein
MKPNKMKKIPYGLTDYEKIITGGYYYVDKTSFLRDVEDAGNFLFFIRPRRFGKSLFLSVMETYYDVLKKDRFEEFFSGLDIAENPTEERNSYLILKFNFSSVNCHVDHVERSFLDYVKEAGRLFLYKYRDLLVENHREDNLKKIDEKQTASDVLRFLLGECRKSGLFLYVIIDEYDNFANTILSTSGRIDYEKLTRGEGFYRSFFNVLKEGTTGSGAPISRLFITGVSPITLDDVTSGFNIGTILSLDARFNRMLGFTKEDVTALLEYYTQQDSIRHPIPFLLDIMTQWYGRYLFSEDAANDERMFNTDMVLYFLNHYVSRKKLPRELIDPNVRIDYGKLRHLITVDSSGGKTLNGNFSRLKQIAENGETSSVLVEGFSLEKLSDSANFVSLLFYFGLLTIDGTDLDRLRLIIPNETVKRLFYDYISEAYRETNVFSLDVTQLSGLMSDMALKGKWEPLFQFITNRMSASMSLRDLIAGEKTIQAFLSVYLGLSQLYLIHTEREMNKGFADIVMEPFLARYEDIAYSYILEVKYIPRSEMGKKSFDKILYQLKSEAIEQLDQYCRDEKFLKRVEHTSLIKLTLIFCGHELVYIGSS